jgi:hypothetical protein
MVKLTKRAHMNGRKQSNTPPTCKPPTAHDTQPRGAGDGARADIESGGVERYTHTELHRLSTMIRKLDPVLLDNVPSFAKQAKHRLLKTEELVRSDYEKALLRMLRALNTIYSGIFPTQAMYLFERACENYTQL